jgi:hypothetical protein
MKENIKQTSLLYRQVCNQYLALFCKKHGYDLRDADWVGGEPGDIATIGDYYVGMRTIIDDLEMDAPEEEFIKWYDYNLVANEFGFTTPNFESWLRGCPRVSDEASEKLQGLKNDLDNAILEEQARLNK